jgi:hypothetical protein
MICALSIYAALPCALVVAPRNDQNLVQDLCAIAALPGGPGGPETGDAAARDRAVGLADSMSWSTPATDVWPTEIRAKWKLCRSIKGFARFGFSPDRKLAFSYGGTDGGVPLGGQWGECVYEKINDRWRTLACWMTEIS